MKNINVSSRASVVDEDGIMWLSECYFNGLFKFNINTKQLEFVGYFDDFSTNLEHLHSNAYIYGEEVIFTPLFGKTIGVYNKKNNKFITVEIPVQERITTFYPSIRVRDFIYIVSDDFMVWEYNLENKEVIENKEITTICKEFALNIRNPIIVSCYDDVMILFERRGKRGCQIDFRTFEVTYLTTEIEEPLDIVFYDGERYWFFLFNSLDIVSWDGKQSYKVYKADNDEWVINRGVIPYTELKRINGQIFISNYYAKHIMEVNEEKQAIQQVFSYPSDFEVLRYNGCGATFFKIHTYKEKIIFVPGRGNMMLLFEPEKQIVEGIKLELAKNEIPEFQKVIQCKLKDGMFEGDGIVELDDLIFGCEIESNSKENKYFGQAIWYECKF